LKKNPSQKMAGGMTQVVGPEFKPHYCKKKFKNSNKDVSMKVVSPLRSAQPEVLSVAVPHSGLPLSTAAAATDPAHEDQP
jgi:hypothetical protein